MLKMFENNATNYLMILLISNEQFKIVTTKVLFKVLPIGMTHIFVLDIKYTSRVYKSSLNHIPVNLKGN